MSFRLYEFNGWVLSIVKAHTPGSYSDVASRTQFFAFIDLIVSVLTLTFQLLLTGPLRRVMGVGGALVALTLTTIAAFTAMALAPVLH